MGRPTRMVVPGQTLLIMQRGNNGQRVFVFEEDYRRYLSALRDAVSAFGVALHAYVLMADHVHLLVTPSDRVGPSRMMQSVGREYARYVNDVYRRSGTLWDGRYKSSLIDAEGYLMLCSHYIETDPVRAGVVAEPRGHRWTSHHHNAFGEHDKLLSEHVSYCRLGDTKAERLAVYRSLFDVALSRDELDAVRLAAETGAVLGDQRFRDQMEATLQRRITRYRHGGDRKSKIFRGQRDEASV